MTNPTFDLIAETKADPRWNLPVWLVLVCVVTFSVQSLLAHGSRVHSIPDGWFTDDTQIHNVTAFFAWTAAANRLNAPFSYTANCPHDDLISNQPPAQFSIWSIVSAIILIGAIALFFFIYLRSEDYGVIPANKAPVIPQITASQKSQKIILLFFLIAMTLCLIQIGAGIFGFLINPPIVLFINNPLLLKN